MLKKLPLSSAADHGGWRYEHLKWAFSLDFGRSRPSDAHDSLDVVTSFVAGRAALAMIASSALPSMVASRPHAVHGFWEGVLSLSVRRVILPPTAGFGPLQLLALCLAVWCPSALRLAPPSASLLYFSPRQLNPALHGLVLKRTGHHGPFRYRGLLL